MENPQRPLVPRETMRRPCGEGRINNPLNATESQQIIENAKKLGIPIESNLSGLMGIEKTGQWAGVPHFKVGNVHIPIEKGISEILKF